MKDIQSVPVGSMSVIDMFPMDFEEFLIANSVNDDTINYLNDRYRKLKPVDEQVHKHIMDMFNKYLVIGGLPKAIKEYVETNNIDKAYILHNDNIKIKDKKVCLPIYFVMFI